MKSSVPGELLIFATIPRVWQSCYPCTAESRYQGNRSPYQFAPTMLIAGQNLNNASLRAPEHSTRTSLGLGDLATSAFVSIETQ